MFTTIFFVALTISAFEIGIAHNFAPYRKWASRYILVNLAGSIALSFVVALLFGASGVILMVASMLSTMMTIPYYRFMRYWDGGGRQSWTETKATIVHLKARWHDNWKELVKNTARAIEITLRVITAPIRAYRAVEAKYQTVRTTIHNVRSTP